MSIWPNHSCRLTCGVMPRYTLLPWTNQDHASSGTPVSCGGRRSRCGSSVIQLLSAPLSILLLEGFDLLEVDEVAPFHLDRTEALAAHEVVDRRPRHAAHLGRLGLADQRHAVRDRRPLLFLSHKIPFIR